MKKKLLCLFLCFALLLSFSACLTSCNKDKEGEEEELDADTDVDRSTMTLSMYVVTENKVNYTADELAAMSDADRAKAEAVIAAYDAVEDEINKITKSKFKTQLEMFFLTEDEYYATVEGAIVATEEEAELAEAAAKALKKFVREQKQAGNTDTEQVHSQFYAMNPQYAKYQETTLAEGEEATTTADETVLNEWGVAELKYPDLVPNQVDILWLGGVEKYMEYAEKEWLSQLNEELNGASKKLKDFIYPEFLDAANVMTGGTYAIPNNDIMGEYTYLLLDKKLMEKYYYDAATIKGIADIEGFMADVVAYEKDYIPFAGEAPLCNVHYWSIDTETYTYDPTEFSMIGYVYPSGAKHGANMVFGNLLRNDSYKSQLLTLKTFEEKGYFVKDYKSTDKFAATVMKGGADLEKIYGEDYEMIVLEMPMASEETLFGSMFGVGAYTASITRSMEIITFLNTNSDFRNLLQYGIEGVNYRILESGKLERQNQNYMMDLRKTGNIFIAYPEEDMEIDAWDWARKQNLDAGTYPTVGFKFDKADPIDEELVNIVAGYTAEVKKEIDACKTVDELNSLFTNYQTKYAGTQIQVKKANATQVQKYVFHMTRQDDVSETTGIKRELQSPYAFYWSWLEENGFVEHA